MATVLRYFTTSALMLLILYIRDYRLLIGLNILVRLYCFIIFKFLRRATPAIVFRRSPAVCFQGFLRLLPYVEVLIQTHTRRLVSRSLLIFEECVCLIG